MAEEEFRVNEHIVLKLEGGKTNIYIDNEFFSQCKHLLIINPLEIRELDEINSIDQVAQILSIEKEEITNEKLIITPEQEFWGHCSNMQVWVENDYDTRLIHSNLAFPLLKKLSKIGINGAEFKFKEEVFKRLEEKYAPVNNFLLREGYTYLLGDDLVLEAVLPAEECKTMRNIIHLSKERYELYIGSRSQRAKIKNGQLKSPFYFIEDNHVSHLDLILDRENKETILKETSNLSNLRSLRISVFDLGKKSINLDLPLKKLEKLEIIIFDKKNLDDLSNVTVKKRNQTEIQGDFINFPNLKNLILSGGSVNQSLLKSMKSLKMLKELYLGEFYIGEMPKSLKKLNEIEVLETELLGLKEIPYWIGDIKSLKKIKFYEKNELIAPEQLKKNKKIEIKLREKNASRIEYRFTR